MSNTFFDRYAELCRSSGETPNSVAKSLGIPSGSITAWKNGSQPRNNTLAKIADYFNVSTDYLLGQEKAPNDTSECFPNAELVEQIRKLARERKTSLTKIETDLKFGNGMIGKWAKAPKSPPYDKLRKIAEYLNISVESLVGEEKTPAETGKRFPKKDSDLVFLSTEEQRRLYRYFSEAAERKGESIDLAVTQSGIPHNLMTRMHNESVSMCDRNDLLRLSEYLGVQTDAKPMLESLPPLDARRAELYRHLHDLVDQVRPEDADTAESLLRVFLDKR